MAFHSPPRIAIISTGGTIEKTYDELSGLLENRLNVLDVMLASLTLHGVAVERIGLMNKDSLAMTPEDHQAIAQAVAQAAQTHDGVLVVHGTDRLHLSGEHVVALLQTPQVPVIFTGAMRPYEMRNSDATQNLTEALLAVQIAAPGVYVAMHNRLLKFPGVVKDPSRGTFVYARELH